MFSIFKKNIFLADYLSGITDFHSHILPGIDDGAKNIQESEELIKGFEQLGITNLIATPHVMGEFYPNTPNTIEKAYNKIIDSKIIIGHLGYSAEYMMDQHFVEIIEAQHVIPIFKNQVLVEMSYFQPPLNLNEILFKLQNNGFQPILAHPERYSYLHSKSLEKYEELKSRGCKFQINMLSLSNHYGIGIQKMAYKLIENNLIDYVSSDVHKTAHLEKIKLIKIPKKMQSKLEHICDTSKSLLKHKFSS